MAADFVALGVMDGPTADVTEWSTHLSFTGSQVVDRQLSVFHKKEDPEFFRLFHRQRRRYLPLDRTLAESGVVHGDVLELRSLRDALDPNTGKAAGPDRNIRTPVAHADTPKQGPKDSQTERALEKDQTTVGGGPSSYIHSSGLVVVGDHVLCSEASQEQGTH